MKYVVMIDWKTNYKNGFDYEEIEAKDTIELIEKADDLWREIGENVYLMKLLKKSGKVKRYDGFRVTPFTSILCRRSYGWHRTNAENGESEVTVKQFINKYFTSYEIA